MLEIITYPNEKLREKSKVVDIPLSKEDSDLLIEMYRFVKNPENKAYGLSAIQVGVAKRMCAIKYNDKAYKLVNPKILSHGDVIIPDTEGCLSVVPDRDVMVPRWQKVKITAFDTIQNKWIVLEAYGTLARILQHEIDHMDGKLYIDYAEVSKDETKERVG